MLTRMLLLTVSILISVGGAGAILEFTAAPFFKTPRARWIISVKYVIQSYFALSLPRSQQHSAAPLVTDSGISSEECLTEFATVEPPKFAPTLVLE